MDSLGFEPLYEAQNMKIWFGFLGSCRVMP